MSLVASTTGQATVTFDPPFSSPPVVTVSAVGTFYISHLVTDPTTTDVIVGVRRYNDTPASATITVHWRAEP